MPMVIPVGILVLVIALLFAFSYYGAGDWYIGVIVTFIGVALVVVMFAVAEQADRTHHRPPISTRYDRSLFLLGCVVAAGGMMVMLIAGGVLDGLASTIVLLMGLGILVAGVLMFILSLRS
jgi:uncharacterized membrane protein